MGGGTQGYAQQLTNGDYVLVMRPQVRVSKSIEILAHELGHILKKLNTKMPLNKKRKPYKLSIKNGGLRQRQERMGSL